MGSGGGIFEFTVNSDGSFTVESLVNNVSTGSIEMNGDEFTLGVDWATGYVGDSSYSQAGSDLTSFNIEFDDGSNSGSSLVIDVEPAEVPVPSAALLFGSSLIGLTAIGRRQQAF